MIHQYKLNGYNIVLDVCSGAVHVVDDAAYDAIAWYEQCGREELLQKLTDKYHEQGVTPKEAAELLDDIDALKAAGKLFSDDPYEKLDLSALRSGGVVKALCLHVAHTCNLSCDYCFASQGKYHGERALMSFEVGKQALDFLMEHSGSRNNLEVDFFGGEPLMNWDVVKRLVAYARQEEGRRNKTLPLHPDHQRPAARRRGDRLLPTGRCTTSCSAWTAARRSTTGCVKTSAGSGQLRSDPAQIPASWPRAGASRDIMSGEPSPITTPILSTISSTWPIWALPSSRWSRWSARPATPTR